MAVDRLDLPLDDLGLASGGRYFFECLTEMMIDRIEFSGSTEPSSRGAWFEHVRQQMADGRMIYYLGAESRDNPEPDDLA